MNQTPQSSWNNYRKYLGDILRITLQKTGRDAAVSVNVILVDDEAIRHYNHDFRSIDAATDVLSFVNGEISEGKTELGDIIISVEALRRQARDYGHTLKREFCFLVAHGYLHLLGYDHYDPDQEALMFGLQEEILSESIG